MTYDDADNAALHMSCLYADCHRFSADTTLLVPEVGLRVTYKDAG